MCNYELCEPIDNRHARALINAIVSGVALSDACSALRHVALAVILCSLLLGCHSGRTVVAFFYLHLVCCFTCETADDCLGFSLFRP